MAAETSKLHPNLPRTAIVTAVFAFAVGAFTLRAGLRGVLRGHGEHIADQGPHAGTSFSTSEF